MNKQRFLAELRQLLVFMTDSDRSITMDNYSAMFDEAGERGEAALLEKLGSPTKVAISLSRGYKPGQLTTETKQRRALEKAEERARAAKTISADTYDPGDVGDDDPVAAIMKSLDETDDETPEAPSEEAPEEDEDDEDVRDGLADLVPNMSRPSRPTVYRRTGAPMSKGAGVTLLVVILLFLGLPLAVLGLALAAAFLLPGAAGVLAAGLAAIAALWCLGNIADAFLVFGVAFIFLAVAVMLIACGIWLDVQLVRLYILCVSKLCDGLLGKKEAVE